MVILAPGTLREMLNQVSGQYTRDIVVDAGKCTGCMDCVEACEQAIAHEHTTTAPIPRIKVKQAATGDGIYLPMLCRNCADAPCVTACMTGCRLRDVSGWVTTDYGRCVGCWMCVMTCPFGAIEAVHEEALARKCDGCTSYEVPPCVSACEPRSLRVEGAINFTHDRQRTFATHAGAWSG